MTRLSLRAPAGAKQGREGGNRDRAGCQLPVPASPGPLHPSGRPRSPTHEVGAELPRASGPAGPRLSTEKPLRQPPGAGRGTVGDSGTRRARTVSR